jgi:RNA polymerase primary sigma factor
MPTNMPATSAQAPPAPLAERRLRLVGGDLQAPRPSAPARHLLQHARRHPLLTAAQEVELAQQIEAGLMAEHRLAGHPADEALAAQLHEVAAAGREAKQRMILANLRLVAAIAQAYRGRGLELEDLVQEGTIGLIRAVEMFDYTVGTKFSSYGTWWIRRAMQRAIAERGRTIRVPVHVGEELDRLHAATGSSRPSAATVAEELGVSEERIRHLQRIDEAPISLDGFVAAAPEDEGDPPYEPLAAVLHDEADPAVEESVAAAQQRAALGAALAGMPEQEAAVLRLRFGIGTGRPQRLQEVALATGLTAARVRQIEIRALGKLRHPSRSHRLLA